MFAKVFTQILDSSLAEDYQVRHVFEDMLKLCDRDGVIDMTHDAIARRTNVPVDIIRRAITELEKPDPKSRSADHDGRRLVRLDESRDWGWIVVNYQHYRDIASDDQRRAKTRARVRKHRSESRLESCNAGVTPRNAPPESETPANASNARQKKKQRHKQRHLNSSIAYARERDKKTNHAARNGSKVQSSAVSESEKAAMERCMDLIGPISMANWGGRWRNRFREEPDKFNRVMNELAQQMKERDIANPGGYADDLWEKRFA